MRYFLDAEFNGFGGNLISLALVPEDDSTPAFYEAMPCTNPNPWVAEHVMPNLNREPIQRADMVRKLAAYIAEDPHPVIVSDWPEDIAHLALMMMTGPGWRMPSDRISFELLDLPLFDSEASSAVPHNAFHDAVAFRDYIREQERSPSEE
jgi:hypothetical protein